MTDLEKIDQLLTELQSLKQEDQVMKIQMARLVSDQESEKGTHARTTDHLLKMLKEQRDEYMDILYGKDRKSGLVVDVDRLNNTSSNIQRLWWAVITSGVGMIFLVIREFLTQ